MNRNIVIVLSVVVFHITALWALQTGLGRREVVFVTAAEILSETVEAPKPKLLKQAPPALAPKLASVKKSITNSPTPLPTHKPQTLAIADPAPSHSALVSDAPPQSEVRPVLPAVATAPAAPALVEMPSSDANYLQNPKPAYPALSKRLGEQGKVVVRALIEVNGTAQKAEIKQSSGFARLDQSALETVQSWRYVPGKRAGVAQAMWFDVPINFILE